MIDGRPFPKVVAKQREQLVQRIRREGFDAFVESVAYTWFNRFVAIRYMEVNGYLSHGYRVLSSTDAKKPMPNLTGEQRRIYEQIGDDWRTVDDIIEASGLPPGKTAATLALLKLMRLVEQGPGQAYKKR